ncbi:uncharacterized protein LOC143227479 [Tachypleus tridentatus]|uniref:uncharacterized protein LOC143227479 n=1 Tax=Tachypleus tridentatus TaxID=6853 RepID=UPI003FD4B1D3
MSLAARVDSEGNVPGTGSKQCRICFLAMGISHGENNPSNREKEVNSEVNVPRNNGSKKMGNMSQQRMVSSEGEYAQQRRVSKLILNTTLCLEIQLKWFRRLRSPRFQNVQLQDSLGGQHSFRYVLLLCDYSTLSELLHLRIPDTATLSTTKEIDLLLGMRCGWSDK